MSVSSMTGFGKGESTGSSYTVSIEIKSVNHRFKDLGFKMSSIFNPIEISMREKISNHFSRGSFDIYVNYKKKEDLEKSIDLDYDKIKNFMEQFQQGVTSDNSDISVRPTDFLRNEFIKEQDEGLKDELRDLALKALDQSLGELKKSRSSEGEKLLKAINQHVDQYLKSFKVIVDIAPSFQKKIDEKLRKKFEESKNNLQVDEPRFLQEVIYYLEKSDIQEEIDRINGHVSKLNELLKGGGEVGRKVDFLVQELNRETNTIGSKSIEGDVSNSVVNMKSNLEKIREQGLNIE